ncbi:MAG: hypothetical protein HN719_07045, partial [Alphaproteobacteria bacterium]|nr:hypothetical protein [Alphaproteobacteria bacterium]
SRTVSMDCRDTTFARGTAEINGQQLDQGDGVSIDQEGKISITATSDAEFLLFDMA